MKKKIAVVLLIQCIIGISAFASSKIRIKKNQVAVITKIHVETRSDTDYIFKAFKLPEEAYERNNNYFLPCLFPTAEKIYDAGYIIDFEEQAEAEDGQYCLAIYDLPEDRILRFIQPIQYLYHKDILLNIYLPMDFKVKVPEGDSCIYLGDLNYVVEGEFFTPTSLKITDSYDDAVKFLKSFNGTENLNLCRVELNPLSSEDETPEAKKITINLSKGGNRFIMKDRCYSYRQ